MIAPTDSMRLYFEADGSPRPWTQCDHHWVLFFGPAMRCSKCGAGTICNTGDRKAQMIDAPLAVLNEVSLQRIAEIIDAEKHNHEVPLQLD